MTKDGGEAGMTEGDREPGRTKDGREKGDAMVDKPLDELTAALRALLPADSVITDPVRLRTYECDGLTYHRATPGVVVLPETAEQIAGVVRACNDFGVPFVARGSGTGLSGGALPRQ